MFAFDVWAPAAFVVALLLFPWLGGPFWAALRRAGGALAARRGLAVLVIGLLSLAVNGAVALRRGMPVPAVTDEFSYLLAADTFAHGRAANPPHALWPHFESEEIIQQPTYQSKYPPAQGLFLGLGQALTGHPAAGVFLSLALACAALCWMLQAFLDERWALLGGLMAALSPGLVDGWGQSYWGGAVAMLGGALLFGGMRRLVRPPGPRAVDAAVMALGAALLANSRPFEGLLACLVAGVGVLPALRGRTIPLRGRPAPTDGNGRTIPLRGRPAPTDGKGARANAGTTLRKVILPAALVLLPAGAAMGYYNARVTGSATTMPYQVWYRTYVGGNSMLKGMFAGEKRVAKPRVLRGARPLTNEAKQTPVLEALRAQKRRQLVAFSGAFFLPGVIALALLGLPSALRDRYVLLALAGVVLVFGFVFKGATIYAPHYSAPVTALVFALLLAGLRRVNAWSWRGRRAGRWTARAIVASWLVAGIAHAATETKVPPYAAKRHQLVERFEQDAARHLVVVRYDPTHQSTYEWVYNAADIDGAKVVWARELDPPDNAKLAAYFKDRTQWLLDAETLELTPYAAPAAGAGAGPGAGTNPTNAAP